MKRYVALILAVALVFTMAACGKSSAPSKLAITSNPTDVTAEKDTKATFSVKATGSGLSYQWQYRTSENGAWKASPAEGNTTATLTVPATASRNGYQYRCAVTDSTGTVYSGPATLTIK